MQACGANWHSAKLSANLRLRERHVRAHLVHTGRLAVAHPLVHARALAVPHPLVHLLEPEQLPQLVVADLLRGAARLLRLPLQLALLHLPHLSPQHLALLLFHLHLHHLLAQVLHLLLQLRHNRLWRRLVQRLNHILGLQLQQPLAQHLHLLQRLAVHHHAVARSLARGLGHLLHVLQLRHLFAQQLQLPPLMGRQSARRLGEGIVLLKLAHQLGLLARHSGGGDLLQVALHDGVQLEEVAVHAVEAVVVGMCILGHRHHPVGEAARGDGLVDLVVAVPHVGDEHRLAVAAQRVLQEPGQLGGAVRNVAGALLGQGHDYLLQEGERLVDIERLPRRGARHACLVRSLTAREVHQVELGAQLLPV
mmetsp:Transcript_14150/g.35721  ORF Transcript_14150/g.35721 Transcript_14150/m.35721 type:complete len:364 (-) Transcript_14150:717-1808(-)